MKHLAHLATRFLNTPLMIHLPKFEVIVKALGPRLGVDPGVAIEQQAPLDATATLMSRYGDAGDEREYSVIDGIAVIPVQGTLLKKETFMSAYSGTSSYEQLQRQVADAVEDAGVSAILLDIDSPGGETAGCFDLADYLYSVRKEKPLYAVANDIALSAAYAIASSASKIYLNRTGAVGSIGVYALHMDQSAFDKDLGVKYTYVFAGDHKVDGNPHEPLSERAQVDIQQEVDREYEIFTETVARNRKASKKNIVATQASVVWADNAIPLLADEIGTFDDAMNALRQAASGTARASAGRAKGRGNTATMAASTVAIPTAIAAQHQGDSMQEITQPLAAKPEEETERKKSQKGEDEAKECDGKAPGKEKDDEEEDEQDGAKKGGKKGKEKDEGKKAAAVTLTPGEPLKAMRAESDIQAIAALLQDGREARTGRRVPHEEELEGRIHERRGGQ